MTIQQGRSGLQRVVERTSSGRARIVFTADRGLDATALAAELRRETTAELRFDNGSRALYATDSSNYRQVPIGVVLPRSKQDVVQAMAVCRRHGVPITSRGCGTSLAGQTTNTAVILDFSKYLNHVLEIDPVHRRARVEPGCILDVLRDAVEQHGLTFGPDPATHDHNTLGGMIGNNSCGPHSIVAGRTADNVEALEVLTYDGTHFPVGRTPDDALRAILATGGRRAEIYRALDAFRHRYADLIRARFPKIPRRVSGYADLDKLLPEHGFDVAKALVGSEGTLVTVLEATLRLIPSPPERTLVVLGFNSIFDAADAVPRVLEFGPIAVEGIDHFLVDAMQRKSLNEQNLRVLPEAHDWLVVQFGGETEEEAHEKAERLKAAFQDRPRIKAKLVKDEPDREKVWKVREAGLPASAYVPGRPETWEGWEDTAVPREKLGAYLRDFRALLDRYGYQTPTYGHFGDGLVHARISFDLRDEPGVATWRRFMDEAADLVVRYGGSLSGEHGDGQSRAALLEKMYGPELIQAFREFKAIWDSEGRMNPGKVVDPYPIVSNLRLGPEYRPPREQTWFAYGQGSFAGEAERCVGVGKCRRVDPEGGIMCPSFLATREEKHTTRGRARLLFEMLHGGPLDRGWRSQAVHDALSLCLACKGCKHDCPVNVDMATYKAEFHAHYYQGRLRPRAAYSMGLIQDWARLASFAPRAANALMRAPGIARVAKSLGGIAQARQLPPFAPEPFTRWFRRRDSPRGSGRPRVVLWPDTFNNFFRPETARAALRLLEAGGYEVHIPARILCCGRPLYDQGMLGRAKRLWRETLDTLRPEIEAGTPVVGLEPACVTAFLDELPGLFPDDPRAGRLRANTHFISDFIQRQPERFPLRRARERAKVQIHCHHHAVIGPKAEHALLDRLGLDYEVMSHGCCGMAGAFGFAAATYETAQSIAERGLFPALRAAPPDAWVIADGFSCREQIEQGLGRGTVHIAELAAACLSPAAR